MQAPALTPRLSAILLKLNWQDKELWRRYSSHPNPNEEALYLRTLAANLIPQGHYALARKLLNLAVNITNSREEKAWLYANLYQISAENNQQQLCRRYCQKVLDSGHLTQWAEETLAQLNEKPLVH